MAFKATWGTAGRTGSRVQENKPPRLAPLCPAVRSGPCVTGRVMSEDACLRLCRGFGVRMVVGFTERQLGPKALQSQL